jgi:tRNA pseudouridine38-40 synthase
VPTFKITLAYDGTGLVGWQRQESGLSVQGLVEDALRRLEDRHVSVTGAGRTDAGVHALGQVASFTISRVIEAAALVRALNANLPASIRVMSAEQTSDAFHARFDARCKAYRYRMALGETVSPFERQYVWHIGGALDVDAMCAAARLIEGRHDFATFQAAGSSTASTVREVFSSVLTSVDDDRLRPGFGACAGPLLLYDITGNGFLRHMVRNIAGSLVEIGRGRRSVEWLTEILEARDRRLAGPTAPGCGLVLVAVEYGGTITAKDSVHVA